VDPIFSISLRSAAILVLAIRGPVLNHKNCVTPKLHLRSLEESLNIAMADSLSAHIPPGVVDVTGVSAGVHLLGLGGLGRFIFESVFDFK
jgi:hypothetical protein